MKHIPNIAAALLGLAFTAFGAMFLLDMMPEQAPPAAGSPAAHFMDAMIPTGYMKFVKVLELTGGLLVLLPRTRAIGLLVLGPIIVNIVAYHVFLVEGAEVFDPIVLAIGALALFVLLCERSRFATLLRSTRRD